MACTRGRRHPFPCGHRGYGEICHRCKQADSLLAKIASDAKNPNALGWKLEAERLKTIPKNRGQMAMPAAPVAV